jgi:signal transduction histidine kinase
MAGETDKYSIEKRFIRKNGSVMWGELVVSLARDDASEPLFAIAMLEDIDARKLAEETRERTIQALSDAVRAREVFLAIASHELRTPLTPLKLSLRILDRKARAAGHTPSDEVTNAIRQVDRLETLVEKLLAASRLATGRLVLTRDSFDLVALAREVAARFAHEAERASCTLSVAAAAPVPVIADRARIEQVATILIANAIKFGRGQPVEVVVDTTPSHARLEVTDHGIGIAPENQEKIFARFSRAVSEMEYGGLGLGLFISREIVDAHGGRLTVRSVKGQGATFVVELPAGR